MKIAIIKAGGSILSNPQGYIRLAERIADLHKKGLALVIVVSAMKGVTDELIKIGYSVSRGEPDPELLDELLSMGERTSARILALALKSLGLNVRFFDPAHMDWPLITNEDHGCASPILEDTYTLVNTYLKPLLLKGVIVVVPGFIGVSKETHKITTLGRNTSDLTAALLAKCLKADLLVYLKDTGGILPCLGEEKVQPLSKIRIDDLRELTKYGAKILHPKAISHFLPSTRVLFTSLNTLPDLKGTEVLYMPHTTIYILDELFSLTYVGVSDTTRLLSYIIPRLLRYEVVDLVSKKRSLIVLLKHRIEDQDIVEKPIKNKLAEVLHIEPSISLVHLTSPHTDLFLSKLSEVRKHVKIYEVVIMDHEAKLLIPSSEKKKLLSILRVKPQEMIAYG